jgi:hypothetical protein
LITAETPHVATSRQKTPGSARAPRGFFWLGRLHSDQAPARQDESLNPSDARLLIYFSPATGTAQVAAAAGRRAGALRTAAVLGDAQEPCGVRANRRTADSRFKLKERAKARRVGIELHRHALTVDHNVCALPISVRDRCGTRRHIRHLAGGRPASALSMGRDSACAPEGVAIATPAPEQSCSRARGGGAAGGACY